MKFTQFYKVLERSKYYVFSTDDVLAFFPDLTRGYLNNMLYRWKKRGLICSLKKGLYELAYPGEHDIPDMYIANKLYQPSYISLETALSNYSIIPEVSMAVTSITTKPTRRFKNTHGLFIYRTVKPVAFTGYHLQTQRSFDILIAEPEKALVDFLYFRVYPKRNIDVRAERLDKDVISRLSKKKLNKYAKLYGFDPRDIYDYL